jgi:hypothetical protein
MESVEQYRSKPPMTAAEVKSQVRVIQEILDAVMIKDVHYGTIPGTQKPTLYKPGSEKILATFHIAADPRVIDDLSTDDEIRYRVKVYGVSYDGCDIFGVGIGECSSDEEKYKWRRPVCDEEFDETPEDRKRQVWKRGKEKNYQQKQVRTNPSDVANTILKMAKKRGQIDMTLTTTAASDVFEQDLEDIPEEIREGMTDTRKNGGKPHVDPPKEKATTGDDKPAREKLKDELEAFCLTPDGVDVEKMKKVVVDISSFGKAPDVKSFSLDDMVATKQDGTYKISDKWIGTAIGNLRKLAEGK